MADTQTEPRLGEPNIVETKVDTDLESAWYGVSIGDLAYMVRATDGETALNHVLLEELGSVPSENIVPSFVHRHEDEYQDEITSRYQDRSTVRVIPFSMVEFPEPDSELTDEQQQAFDKLG